MNSTQTVTAQGGLQGGGFAAAPSYKCAICGRPLSDPRSTQRGIGPICACKRRSDGDKADGQEGDRMIFEPLSAGILLQRDEDGGVRTNVPRTVVHHSPDGYEWGYGGSGPADLALNILEAMLHHMGWNGGTIPCYRGRCFAIAWALHQDFKWEFIATMPKGGGFLSYDTVREWIEKGTQEVAV
jgi:hypothetical protein